MRQTSAAPPVLPIVQTMARHLEAFRHHHSTALEETGETAEAIHKVRVTTRRLQADLDLLQCGPNSAVVRDLKQRLRDFRNSLSTIRNYDVFIGIIEAELQRAEDADLADLALLARRLHEERDQAAAEARKILGRFKLKRIVSMLGESNPDEKTKKHRLEFRGLDEARLKRRAARRLEARLADFLGLVTRLRDTSDTDGIHQLRIAAKRLRYLIETLTDLGFRAPKGALRWLRAEQGKIGDWHDLFCLEEEVLGLVGKREARHGKLDESAALLRATAKLLKAREMKASRTFPVKPPNYFERSVGRLARDVFPRNSAENDERGKPRKNS
ncbi:MAG: CHAD domain-containing protein [Acidobacteria bacterium]|nr:MAG: CHAD domain-containing protein [Acidobacteriota bacterium]